MIRPEIREQVRGHLEGFLQNMIDEFRPSEMLATDLRPTRIASADGEIKPFHESILPDGVLRISEFERSFSTKLGSTLEECARLIASSRFRIATRRYRLSGTVSAAALSTIESVTSDIDSNGMQRSYLEVARIVSQTYSGDMANVRRSRLFDLFLEDSQGNQFFFEMKSPKPNKDQCTRVTARLLLVHAMQRQAPEKIRTYYAMSYNPYGDDRKLYSHDIALRYLDMENQVLLGNEFWEFIGGPGTYDEVKELYREVGVEKGPEMIRHLLPT